MIQPQRPILSAEELLQLISGEIEQLQFDTPPASLFDPVSYTLSLGGKRIRPLLTLMGCMLFGGEVRKALPVALAIEVFHNFTLLHDDLMDKADMRRGKPTVHRKWDDNTAILSGDAMLIESYHLLAQSDSHQLQTLLKLFSTTATEICGGQWLDMEFEKRMNVSEAEYLEMIRLKTAVLLGCALKSGAIVASASEADSDLLYDFGVNIGLAFQLKDDLLDVYGNTAKFGKNIGGDIVSNKKTFLLIHALERCSLNDGLEAWLAKTDFDRTEKVEAVTAIYNRLGLRELSEKRIDTYYSKALACLEKVNAPSERKNELLKIVSELHHRQS